MGVGVEYEWEESSRLDVEEELLSDHPEYYQRLLSTEY